jgi:hypothetical protein
MESSMQVYMKWSLGPFIPVYYNRYVEAYKQVYIKCILGPFLFRLI